MLYKHSDSWKWEMRAAGHLHWHSPSTESVPQLRASCPLETHSTAACIVLLEEPSQPTCMSLSCTVTLPASLMPRAHTLSLLQYCFPWDLWGQTWGHVPCSSLLSWIFSALDLCKPGREPLSLCLITARFPGIGPLRHAWVVPPTTRALVPRRCVRWFYNTAPRTRQTCDGWSQQSPGKGHEVADKAPPFCRIHGNTGS